VRHPSGHAFAKQDELDLYLKQIEEAERKLYEVAESGRYEGGFQAFSQQDGKAA